MATPSTAGQVWRPALLVFLLTFLALWWLRSDRMDWNVDEGMYLHGAQRMLAGQAPYRDFFVLVGPCGYWLYGGALRLLGPSLSHARLPLFLELAAMTAALFYLIAHLTTRQFAVAAVVFFFLLEFRDLRLVALNHRWDSSALAFVAIAPAFAGMRHGSRAIAFASGLLAALAAWFTPPLALVGSAVLIWLMAFPEYRKLAPAFVAGIAVVSLACIAGLLAEGALGPMIRDVLSSRTKYAGSNRVPYGWAGTGYLAFGAGLNPIAWLFYGPVLIWLTLPATLPPATWLAWAGRFFWRGRSGFPQCRWISFLLICSVALLVSTWPRWDMPHLLYVAAVFYVLAACFLHQAVKPAARPWLFGWLALWAGLLWFPVASEAGKYRVVQTPAGPVSVAPEDGAFLETFLRRVRPGEGFFSFPYLPGAYFFSGGVNPTRFTFLQPGYTTEEEERIALAELEARPPMWVWYSDVPVEVYLKHWPSSDPNRLRMPLIEEYLRAHYRTVDKISHSLGDYALLVRKDAAVR